MRRRGSEPQAAAHTLTDGVALLQHEAHLVPRDAIRVEAGVNWGALPSGEPKVDRPPGPTRARTEGPPWSGRRATACGSDGPREGGPFCKEGSLAGQAAPCAGRTQHLRPRAENGAPTVPGGRV